MAEGGIKGDGGAASYGRGGKTKKKRAVRTREEFWSTFGAALEGARDDCDDVLCRYKEDPALYVRTGRDVGHENIGEKL